jgi:hypothetical protein
MKNAFLTLLLLVSAAALADWTDVFVESTAKVTTAKLSLLEDGGCSIEGHGQATKTDGGVGFGSTGRIELAGANRTTCLNILSTLTTNYINQRK